MPRRKAPAYSLAEIQEAFRALGAIEIRYRAETEAHELGYAIHEVFEIIAKLQPSHFVKTMHSSDFENEMVDAYVIYDDGYELYIEFSRWLDGTFKLISFHLK